MQHGCSSQGLVHNSKVLSSLCTAADASWSSQLHAGLHCSVRCLSHSKEEGMRRGHALADAAVELPALLLYAFDAGHGLHAPVINRADLRYPVHAGGMTPQPCLCGGLQGTPLNGAQAALWGLAVILQAGLENLRQQ